jgi:hypothetical protein
MTASRTAIAAKKKMTESEKKLKKQLGEEQLPPVFYCSSVHCIF